MNKNASSVEKKMFDPSVTYMMHDHNDDGSKIRNGIVKIEKNTETTNRKDFMPKNSNNVCFMNFYFGTDNNNAECVDIDTRISLKIWTKEFAAIRLIKMV